MDAHFLFWGPDEGGEEQNKSLSSKLAESQRNWGPIRDSPATPLPSEKNTTPKSEKVSRKEASSNRPRFFKETL